MFNYIKSEFYRILNKKSMYIFLGICMIGYIIITLMRIKEMTDASIIGEANFVFTFVSILGGGFMFATIYNDDLTAKTLIPLIGFGEKRIIIAISKIIITIILMSILLISALIAFYLIFTLIGFNVETNILKELYPQFLLTIAYSIVASVLVYGTQKATISIVAFVLLSTGFISQLLLMLLESNLIKNLIGDVARFTIYPIVIKLVDKVNIQTIIPYLIYIIVIIVLSIITFKKKELEF